MRICDEFELESLPSYQCRVLQRLQIKGFFRSEQIDLVWVAKRELMLIRFKRLQDKNRATLEISFVTKQKNSQCGLIKKFIFNDQSTHKNNIYWNHESERASAKGQSSRCV